MRRQLLVKGSLLIAALGALMILGAAQAVASHVDCGDTITQDTKLDSDLVNCTGDGVVIGADGITLDLNGHLIDGTGFPTSGAGVDNNAGHDGVTITGGRIQEFAAGVQLTDASANEITRLTVTTSPGGISVQGDSDSNVISRNVIEEGGIGLLGDTDANVIERNTISDPVGPGIQVLNAFPFTPPEQNRIERNTISGGGEGVALDGAIETAVERNVVSGVQRGIAVTGLRNRIVQNTVSNNEVGIVFGQASETEVVKNDVFDNTGDGIFVGSVARDTLLDRNTSNRNGDDGIDVESLSTAISRNTANFNGDLGVEAVPGVIDAGGNKARGNGDPAQCVGVQCK
jgi:parallel beta-helix repeat protein